MEGGKIRFLGKSVVIWCNTVLEKDKIDLIWVMPKKWSRNGLESKNCHFAWNMHKGRGRI